MTRHIVQDGACIDNSEYGVLAGVGFTLTFALATLFAGRLTDIFNKRYAIRERLESVLQIKGVGLVTDCQGWAMVFRCCTTSISIWIPIRDVNIIFFSLGDLLGVSDPRRISI